MALSVKTGNFGNGNGGGIIPIPEIKFVGEYEVTPSYSTSPINFYGVPIEQYKKYLGFLYHPKSQGPNSITFTAYVRYSGGTIVQSNSVVQNSISDRYNTNAQITLNSIEKYIQIGTQGENFLEGETYKLSLYEYTV